MRPLILSLALAGALTLTGCSSLISLNPFVTDEQAVKDPALPGVWTNAEGKDIYWITEDGSGYKIRYAPGDGDSGVYECKANLMAAGGVKILDLVAAKEDAFQLVVHTPVRVWIEGGTLRFTFLQSDWLKGQVGKQLATAPAKQRLLITAPGEAVGSFLAKIGADSRASDEPEVLHRVQ